MNISSSQANTKKQSEANISHEVQHFEEKGRINHEGYLPSEEYSRALDYLVIACVDVAFLHDNKILIGKRNVYPKKGWWIIGGRMISGESPVKTAQRKAFQEAGLEIDLTRYVYINAYSTCFAQRSQEPQNNGLHSINLTYLLLLNDHEKEQIKLINTEYEDLRWIKLDQVGSFIDVNDELDRALLQIVQDIQILHHSKFL
jgi:ADP-ribose pyrophosphatase YjhB (NUDIX family)